MSAPSSSLTDIQKAKSKHGSVECMNGPIYRYTLTQSRAHAFISA